MAMLTVHLRWNSVGPEEYARVVRVVPADGRLPAGCLSRQLRHDRTALVAVEVWDTEEAAGHMDQLVAAVRAAGLEQPPQTAIFSVPQMYALAYRRAALAVGIPRQPSGPTSEQSAAPNASTAPAA